MTKAEKIHAFLSSTAGTVDGVVATLREHPQLGPVIAANPAVVAEIRDDFCNLMAPFYESVSEAALDAAIAFHMSPAGREFKKLDGAMAPKAAAIMQMWAQGVEKKLAALLKAALLKVKKN